jgi:acetyltransferase-like isoleucine patch superfamily enzyme
MMADVGLAASAAALPEQLALLAGSEDEFVRATVAMNPSTTRETLDALSRDPSGWVVGLVEKRAQREASLLSIHPTAIIHPGAHLGVDVVVGAFSIIHKNVRIGDRTVIGSHCELGHPVFGGEGSQPLVIGQDSFIRSHSVFYEGSSFGDRLVTGHRVTVREGTKAGENLQIGTLSDIQGRCEIGNFVRFHSNVHVGQHSTVGDFVWIFPYVVLTNDPHPPSNVMRGVTVGNYVAIATMSVLLPGVTVAEGALIGAHSSVTRDVDANMVAVGVPAKPVCKTEDIKLKDGSSRPAYPWRRHFHRGYPDQFVAQWIAEFKA